MRSFGRESEMFFVLLLAAAASNAQTAINTINEIPRNGSTNQVVEGGTNIQITNGTTISTTANVNWTSVSVSGSTTLESGTTCAGPLPSSTCLNNFENLMCSMTIPSSCHPTNGRYTTLVVTSTFDSGVSNSINYQLVNQTALTVQNLTSNVTALLGPVTCTGTGNFPSTCFNFSGAVCASTVSSSCLSMSQSITNMNVNTRLQINQVTCPSVPIDSSCTPMRIERINGVSPTAAAFTLTAGTGITLAAITNGLSVAASNTVTTQFQGSNVVAASNTLNFLGTGVSANSTTVYVPGTILITTKDEGININTAVNTLNFQGPGANVTSTGTNSVNVSLPNPTTFYYNAMYSANETIAGGGTPILMTNLTFDNGHLQFAPSWNGSTFSVVYKCFYNIAVSYLSTTGPVIITATQTNTSITNSGIQTYTGQSVAAGTVGILNVWRIMHPGEQWSFSNTGSGAWTPNATYPEYSFMSARCVFI